MRIFVNSLRLIAVIAVVVAVVAQLQHAVAAGNYVFWNFFGYFTIQSNLIIAGALAAAVVASTRKRAATRLDHVRGAATVYIATTGVVFNTLLAEASLAANFDLLWASDVMHKVLPAYAVLDWLLFSDRGRLALRQVWWFLLYPAVWLVVVLIRGATDGWVPYPFLNPDLGYGIVALYSLGVAVFIALMGVLVIGMSRLRIVPVAAHR
ncbi:Pr6Pr family membrane protein [Curtobacterium flaccumfaciens]|nr:Pr6Pr family membrane protein [Curtobacterium flaccumfaciens]